MVWESQWKPQGLRPLTKSTESYASYAVSWIHLKPLFISFWNCSWQNTTSKADASFPTTGRYQKHLKSGKKLLSHETSSNWGAPHNSRNFFKHSLAFRSWPYLEKGTTKANMRCSIWEAAKTFSGYGNTLFTLVCSPGLCFSLFKAVH